MPRRFPRALALGLALCALLPAAARSQDASLAVTATSAAVRDARAIEEAIREADSAREVAAAIERFESFPSAEELPGGWVALGNRVEAAVNSAGYRLLRADRLDEAIAVFALNTRAFPEAANAWDSLAEAHMVRGDRELAIEHYRRSLDLDPGNDNAREKLAELGAEASSGGS